ncbi:hypothetical protein GOODEAATRI_015087 [Goodea atripinnis]|uniref:Uncharacterized protein n=1 Tax=Goodea atripinnis TaxID=208336 RepID=A0ABV0PEC7_9TELE
MAIEEGQFCVWWIIYALIWQYVLDHYHTERPDENLFLINWSKPPETYLKSLGIAKTALEQGSQDLWKTHRLTASQILQCTYQCISGVAILLCIFCFTTRSTWSVQ